MKSLIKTPTPKKVYTYADGTSPYMSAYEVLYHRFFKLNGCTQFYEFANEYSKVDFLLTSGLTTGCNTSVVVEYKNRSFSVADYYNAVIEKDKFDNLLSVSDLLDCPAMYMMEYNEAIVCWQIDRRKYYKSDVLPMPKSNTNSEKVLTPIYYLEYSDAAIIIGKRTMQKATFDQLNYFIKKLKPQ